MPNYYPAIGDDPRNVEFILRGYPGPRLRAIAAGRERYGYRVNGRPTAAADIAPAIAARLLAARAARTATANAYAAAAGLPPAPDAVAYAPTPTDPATLAAQADALYRRVRAAYAAAAAATRDKIIRVAVRAEARAARRYAAAGLAY